MPSSIVNIKKLKEFAIHKLPKNSVLRDILISEEDELDINIFLARLPVWLKLSRFLKDGDSKCAIHKNLKH
jgi:hypothetical protein